MRRCLEYRLQRKDLSIEPFRLMAVLQTPLIDRSGNLLNLAVCQTFFLNAIDHQCANVKDAEFPQ